MTPVEGVTAQDRAAWAGSRRTGGSLIAAAGLSWLLHSILMIVALASLFSGITQLLNPAGAVQAAVTAVFAYLGAVVTAIAASFLLASGLFAYRPGTRGFSCAGAVATPMVSDATRRKAVAAAVAFLAYGVLGILAVTGFGTLLSGGLSVALVGGTVILWSWITSTFVLVVAAGFYSSFLSSLRREIANPDSPGGAGLVVYAVMNLIGNLLLIVPLLLVAGGAVSPALVLPVGLGALLQILVLPIVGVIVFPFLIAAGAKLRKVKEGPPMVAVPVVPASYYYPYVTYAPAVPAPVPPPAPAPPPPQPPAT